MNMRFMMRKQTQPEMDRGGDLTRVEEEETSDVTTIHTQPQHCGTAVAEESSVFINVLGRRSFGGFNRHVENAWTEHASFYGTNTSGRLRKDAADPTDEIKRKRKRHLR